MSKEKEMKDLKYSNFNIYPHYVYATAYLVNGELADYKIGNCEKIWGIRTFRGSQWEKEVYQHGFIDKDWELTCEYEKIFVTNDEEHSRAFDFLCMWLDTSFKKYKKADLTIDY